MIVDSTPMHVVGGVPARSLFAGLELNLSLYPSCLLANLRDVRAYRTQSERGSFLWASLKVCCSKLGQAKLTTAIDLVCGSQSGEMRQEVLYPRSCDEQRAVDYVTELILA